MCAPYNLDEPTSYQEVLTSSISNEWLAVMRDEMSSMARKQV